MIFIVDVDYTLLDDEKNLSQKNLDAMKHAKEQGHMIVINTARSYFSSIEVAKKIDCDYINCSFGNFVVDKNGNEVYSNIIPSKNVKKIIDEMFKMNGGWVAIESQKGSFTTNEAFSKRYNVNYVENIADYCDENAFKLGFGIKEEEFESAKVIAEKFGMDARIAREGYFCMFAPKNSDKYNGLKVVLEKIGKGHGKAIAFGDDESDYMSLKNVDIGVAMANSSPSLLEKIDVVTLSNNDSGVGFYIEKLLAEEN